MKNKQICYPTPESVVALLTIARKQGQPMYIHRPMNTNCGELLQGMLVSMKKAPSTRAWLDTFPLTKRRQTGTKEQMFYKCALIGHLK